MKQRARYEPAVTVCQRGDIVMAAFPTDGGQACCLRDNTGPSGSMFLGGPAREGVCDLAYDFSCTRNWRVEFDDQGCETWRYDGGSPGSCDAGGG